MLKTTVFCDICGHVIDCGGDEKNVTKGGFIIEIRERAQLKFSLELSCHLCKECLLKRLERVKW